MCFLQNNRLNKLKQNAELDQLDAFIAAIDYVHNCKLNRIFIGWLATCEYITEYWNIFITGATGSGKLHGLCLEIKAHIHNFTVKYVRMPDLLIDSNRRGMMEDLPMY